MFTFKSSRKQIYEEGDRGRASERGIRYIIMGLAPAAPVACRAQIISNDYRVRMFGHLPHRSRQALMNGDENEMEGEVNNFQQITLSGP